jgi:List-Bact-rpt repeat protein
MSDNTGGTILLAKWGVWAGLSVAIVVALLFGGIANAGTITPPTTYTISITEKGLPSGTNWGATFNSVTTMSTGSTIKFSGVSAASYYYYPSTIAGSSSTTQYVPTYSYYYVTVPNMEIVTVVYTTEYYTTFAVSPTSSGTINQGTGWYDAGATISIAASSYTGTTFSKWTPTAGITIANTNLEATELTMGAAGTVTADFNAKTFTSTFTEVGLPASTHWTVIFNSASKTSTGTTLTTTANPSGNYYWSIAPVTSGATTEYVASPAAAYMNVPGQTSQQIVFTKEYDVTFAISGTGSVSPVSGYYAAGSQIPIQAFSGTDTFSKWTTTASKVFIGSTTNQGTNATVKGATTVTAVFKTSAICKSACKLTFREVGLPASTPWGVTFGGVSYPSSTSSIAFSGLSSANYYWTAYSPVNSGIYGVAYFPVGTSSNYYYLGQETSIEIVYEEYAYVAFDTNPSYVYGGGATAGSGWYAMNSVNPLSAYNGSYFDFSSWSTSATNVTMGSSTSASTTFTVTGAGWVTENFAQPTGSLHLVEYGLPTGTSWGVDVSGAFAVTYTSSTPWINITGVPYAGYNLYPIEGISGGTGTEWNDVATSASLNSQIQTYASFIYQKAVYVTFAVGPTGTAGSIYTPTTNWYYVGTVLPLIAYNATSGTNPSFKDWSQTTGTATITSTSTASTFAVILATGTITCNFK